MSHWAASAPSLWTTWLETRWIREQVLTAEQMVTLLVVLSIAVLAVCAVVGRAWPKPRAVIEYFAYAATLSAAYRLFLLVLDDATAGIDRLLFFGALVAVAVVSVQGVWKILSDLMQNAREHWPVNTKWWPGGSTGGYAKSAEDYSEGS